MPIRHAFAALRLIALIAFTPAVVPPVEAQSRTTDSVATILLKPKANLSEQALETLLNVHGAKQVGAIEQIDVRILKVPAAHQERIVEALSHNPNVEFAEVDELRPLEATPNDYWYPAQWHLPRMSTPAAWDMTVGSSSITIAILDTGIEGTHPDLAPKMVAGWNFYDGNSNTADVNGHGTMVAGAAAASSNNTAGVASVAWGCKIMPIRISDTAGLATFSAMASGLTWAADRGARVANISYAASDSASVSTAAKYFQGKGGVVTVSSGNQGTFSSTTDNPYVLTVGGVDGNDVIYSWSNTGNNIDVVAPGGGIRTTYLNGTYSAVSGTSAAAPLVAGVAALVLSANPSLTGAQALDIVRRNTDDLGTSGWDTSYGTGRVNAYRAVLAAGGTQPADTVAPVAAITSPSGGATVGGATTVTVSATDNVGVSKIELYIDGVLTATSTTGSAAFSWDTTGSANGTHTLSAKAYDAAGNIGVAANVVVTVLNAALVPDSTAPVAQITSPTNNTVVAKSLKVYVASSDNTAVVRVELYIDQKFAASSTTANPVFSVNTGKWARGQHAVSAVAFDAAGNAGASVPVTVVK
jgi:thermitase